MSAIIFKMLELYEMADMNGISLERAEKSDLLKAKIALDMFERAMAKFIVDEPKTAAATA